MASTKTLDTASDGVRAKSRRAREVLWAQPRLVSVAFGTWFWWAALVPSLLPRSAFFQGVIGAVSFAVGWGVGSLVGQIWDRVWARTGRRDPLVAARPWPLVTVVVLAVVAAVVGTVLWLRWQNDQRLVVGPNEVLALDSAVTLWVVTLVLVAVVVLIGRLVGLAVIRVDEQLPGGGRAWCATSWPAPRSRSSSSPRSWPSSASA